MTYGIIAHLTNKVNHVSFMGTEIVSKHYHIIRHSTDVIRELDPMLRKSATDSYADALRVVFICQVALSFLTFLSCMAIQENPLPYVVTLLSFSTSLNIM
jgi:hypothetical protein